MLQERVRQFRHIKPNISLFEVGTAVCSVFGITEKELREGKSDNYLALAMCVYLCRMKTKTDLTWYCQYFKGMGVEEVLNISSLMRQLVRRDRYLFDRMESVISKVG